MSAYTELKAQSYFSFLRAASSPQELIETAVRLGLKGLALTDVGGVYGAPRAFHALKELREKEGIGKDFKLIVGADILFRESLIPSLVCIAPTRAAYGALCRILTETHRLKAKGTGDCSWSELKQWRETIPHAQELILFPQWEEGWLQSRDQMGAELLRFAEFFSAQKIQHQWFLPLMRHCDGFDAERTQFARHWSAELGWECAAHQQVLYHQEKNQILQDVLTSIREGVPLKELGLKLRRNSERRLKTPEEMALLFADFPEALSATQKVHEQCTFEMSELRYRYPTEWIPAQHTAQSYLSFLCEQGMNERYPHGVPEWVSAKIQHELSLIQELKFADYFLTVYDIVAFARSRKILCQGRGSAANSIVCYVLGITAIDPTQIDLLFERFISVERGEPPDIDVDFEHDRREEVIQYIYEKYGRNRAAMVSAVVTYQPRSALREVAKAFSIDIGTDSAREVRKKLDESKINPLLKHKIEEVSERLMGFPRHLSIHSGGFTLSHEPVDTLVPIEPATMEGRTIIQWDKFDLDVLGLLKIDVLSLGMLAAIRRALEYTGMELYKIPHDDAKTYQMIQKADTIGVFQIESRAQMSMLPRLKPKNFYDLVVEVAIVRPGPIVGGMVHPYLKRRRGLEKVVFPDPRLEAILGKTYGVPIFQEQVMKMAIVLGIFTPGEADRLRRAIGAWRSQGSIDEMGKKLMVGLEKQGISKDWAKQIFDQIQGFAEYGFPESHAASFALLTYASCYLKCHHPSAFLCALLNSQPMGFYSEHSLVDDAKRHGVSVLPVCVQHSEWDATLVALSGGQAPAVRLGFRSIKSLSKEPILEMLQERKEGRFKSFQDFSVRTQLTLHGFRNLAMASAFEIFGMSSREALFEVLALHDGLFHQEEIQQSLFPSVALPKMSLQEKVTQDYASMQLSVRAHPVSFLRAHLKNHPIHSGWLREKSKHGQWVQILGLSVIVQRPPTAKGTAFATLEDEFGVIDLIFHREVFQKYQDTIRGEAFLWVRGQVQRDEASEDSVVQVIVKSVDTIFGKTVEQGRDIRIPIAPGAHQKF